MLQDKQYDLWTKLIFHLCPGNTWCLKCHDQKYALQAQLRSTSKFSVKSAHKDLLISMRNAKITFH